MYKHLSVPSWLSREVTNSTLNVDPSLSIGQEKSLVLISLNMTKVPSEADVAVNGRPEKLSPQLQLQLPVNEAMVVCASSSLPTLKSCRPQIATVLKSCP
jgi:hypothetical protein